jgi:hypothetical protein
MFFIVMDLCKLFTTYIDRSKHSRKSFSDHSYRDSIAPYDGLELELHLENVWPQLGRNLLEIALAGRPDGLAGGLSIEEVELAIEYKT